MRKLICLIFVALLIYSVPVIASTTSSTKEQTPTAPKTTEAEIKVETDSFESKAKSIFNSIFNTIEVFRKKEAVYFANMRDETKVKIGIKVTDDVLKKIAPDFAAPQPPSAVPEPQKLSDLEVKKMDNPVDYGKLIYSTALASLFDNSLMFYGVLIFLTFFAIRLIFRMFI
jgi:hypothetical protein